MNSVSQTNPWAPDLLVSHLQVVWYNSHQVGCAMAHCPKSKYTYHYVCQYCPAWVRNLCCVSTLCVIRAQLLHYVVTDTHTHTHSLFPEVSYVSSTVPSVLLCCVRYHSHLWQSLYSVDEQICESRTLKLTLHLILKSFILPTFKRAFSTSIEFALDSITNQLPFSCDKPRGNCC